MKILKARLKGETPDFFRRIIKAGISLASVGTTILGLPTALAAAGVIIVFPPAITTIGGYLIAAGAVAAAVGKCTVKNPEELPKE